MASTSKTSVVINSSAIVDGQVANASGVTTPLGQVQTQLRSGQVGISTADTHVKHLEDAITAGTGIAITKQNTGADEELAISTSIDAITPTTTKGDLLVDDGSVLVRLPVGTNGQILTADSGEASGVKWATGTTPDYVRLSYTVAIDTDGGIGTTGSWQTRPINTEDSDAGGVCTLSGNEFTLAAGTYYVKAIANFLATSQSQIRIYDVTNTSVAALGINVYARAISVVHQTAYVAGYVTSSGSTTFRIEYRVVDSGAANGLGYRAIWGDNVYAIVEMWRLS